MKKNIYTLLLLAAFFSFATIEAKEAVYFLHGIMMSSSSMSKASRTFAEKGYETHLWGYPSRSKTIEEHANDLVTDLQITAKKSPGVPIHFMTHSMGGIMLRAAINHPECPIEAKIGKASLLSPPNKGSCLGRFFKNLKPLHTIIGDKAGKQLLVNTDFDHIGSFPSSMQILVISGTFGWNPIIPEKNDGIVGISESCLPTPHEHITVFSSHPWITLSKDAIFHSVAFIEGK